MSYLRGGRPDEPDQAQYDWWDRDGEDMLCCLWAAYHRFEDLEGRRIQDHRLWKRLYGVRQHSGETVAQGFDPDRIQLNVVEACVDAATAKIGKQRPRPRPITDGGNASQVRKSRLLQHYLDAQYRRGKYYAKSTQVFRDAAIVGTGHLAVYEDGKDVRYQRVQSEEILVDPGEARFGEPRTMFRRRWVSRSVLCKRFPDLEEEIEASSAEPEDDFTRADSAVEEDVSDMVLLVEAVHLPSRRDAGDGLRVLALADLVLSRDEWKHEYFPVVSVHWRQPVDGYWGSGIPEQLRTIQLEINRIVQKIQAHMHFGSVLRAFVPVGARIQPPQIDNRIGAIIPYSGLQPPTFAVPPAAAPDMYAHLWALWARAHELCGVAMMGVPDQAPKPTSSIGLQTKHDIESERFSIPAQEFERMAVDAALQTIDRARDLGRHNPEYAAPAAKDQYSLEYVEWSKIDMEADSYEIGVQSESALPNDPAGRQAFVEALFGAGLLSPDEAREMLRFPDLERWLSLDRAADELVDTLIERMLDQGEYHPPEPFMDLNLALKKCQAHYNRALIREVPEDRCQLLIDFMTQAHVLLMQAQVQAARVNAQVAGQNQLPAAGAPPAPGVEGAPPGASPGQ